MSEPSDLGDFGVEATHEPPLVERRYIIQSPHTGKIAGFVGTERIRDVEVYTTLRWSNYHYYRKGGGWAISDSILDELRRHDVVLVIVHDGTDPHDDVFVFRSRDYLEAGKTVPTHHLDDEDDPQTYIPDDRAMEVWEDHAEDLFVRQFYEACEHIGWSGYDLDLKERRQEALSNG